MLGELVVDEGLSVRILLVLDGILLVLDGRALRPRQRGSRRRPFDQSHLNGRLNGHSNGQPQCAAIGGRTPKPSVLAERKERGVCAPRICDVMTCAGEGAGREHFEAVASQQPCTLPLSWECAERH